MYIDGKTKTQFFKLNSENNNPFGCIVFLEHKGIKGYPVTDSDQCSKMSKKLYIKCFR